MASSFFKNTAVAITVQPSTANPTYCSGATITALSVTSTGTTPTYQWYSNTTNANTNDTTNDNSE